VTAVFGVTDVTGAPFEVTVRVVVVGSACAAARPPKEENDNREINVGIHQR